MILELRPQIAEEVTLHFPFGLLIKP